jgi:hypothetical protein
MRIIAVRQRYMRRTVPAAVCGDHSLAPSSLEDLDKKKKKGILLEHSL